MNLKLFGIIPKLLKKHAGWILTGLSVAGLTGTVVLVANEAPKAAAALEEAQVEKFDEWVDNGRSEEESYKLTFGEKLDTVAPIYLPAFIVYLLTAGCMIGAQIFNVKQQALLAAAYGMLAQEFGEYRREMRKEIGDEREKQIFEQNHKKILEMRERIRQLEAENKPQYWVLPYLPGFIFEQKTEHITKALMHFNRNIAIRGGAPISELYEFFGVPKSCYNEDDAEENGWESYENEVSWGCSYTDFMIDDVPLADGTTIHVINPVIPAYKLDLDYGGSDSSCDNLYENYIPEGELIENDVHTRFRDGIPDNEIIPLHAPYIHPSYFI